MVPAVIGYLFIFVAKNMLRYSLILLMTIVINTGCHKSSEHNPVMLYTNLNDEEINEQSHKALDFNNDGKSDLSFTTKFIGDPSQNRAIFQYLVMPLSNNTSLLVNDQGESPILKKGDQIAATFTGCIWYPNASVSLVQKIFEQTGSYWYGLWHHVSHQYLAIRVIANGEPYYGWVELSIDTDAEKLVLHKMAICTEANVAVMAGKQ
jgi:hypothetical protein